ncbi:transcriptional regulator [Sinorhizobium meliloti]|nr:transcriptional regulator [Sinorhizobium meliloti]
MLQQGSPPAALSFRPALKKGVRHIAKAAKMSTQAITRMEKGEELRVRTAEDVQRAYEAAGARLVRGYGEGALTNL